jgi:hypothetical protein
MTRSTNGFCQGALGAMISSRIPMLARHRGEALAVDGIPIAEQISRSGLVREDLEDLAGGPDCRRLLHDVQVKEFAAIMLKDDEDEEQAKREGRDEEEVGHGW